MIESSRGSFDRWLGVGRGGEKVGKVETYQTLGSGKKVGRAMRGRMPREMVSYGH